MDQASEKTEWPQRVRLQGVWEGDVDGFSKLSVVSDLTKVQLNDPFGERSAIFPNTKMNHWSLDSFGPITIPAAGATVELTPENIAIYRRIISAYEGNELIERDGKFLINGQETTSYTLQQDYLDDG